MSSSISFTGASFALESIVQLNSLALRLKYQNDPLAASSSGTHDALNVSNYLLLGPALNAITAIFTVSGDPESVDIQLAAPLVAGIWSLSVSDVQTPLGGSLTAPTSLTFNAVALATIPPASLGALDDSAEDLIHKHLSPMLVGLGWDALVAALATGDEYRNEVADLAFDQLFEVSASGIYLDRRASDDGFTRPANIGISDDVFRKLAIKTTARKLVIEVILEALETYYGSEATRAFTASTTPEPYALDEGDTLLVQTENSQVVTINFARNDFTQLGGALAIEVAAVITRELQMVGSTAYAVAFKDPSLNQTFIRIFSGALGLTGGVRIYGGRAQNVLLFPTLVHPTPGDGPQPTTQFTITPGTTLNGVPSGVVRFAFTGGTNPDLQEVQIGDYVNIYGSVFASGFQNTYTISGTSSTYFEILDPKLTWAASVTLLSAEDVRFFRPTKATILDTGRMATATQGDPSQLDVILPATTQAVTRGQNSGAYLHVGTAVNISTATRDTTGTVTINTATNHGLSMGDQVFIDGLLPTINALAGFGWAAADATTNSLQNQDSAAIKLADGTVLASGGSVSGTRQTAARLFTPSTNTWATVTAMTRARRAHTLTLLKTGKILAVGGATTNICELYDVATNTWTDTGQCLGAHDWHTATLLANGTVLVVGGGSSSEVYDPATGLWTTLTNQPAVSRSKHTATLLFDNRVLIVGGGSTLPTGLTSAEIYNTVTGLWVTTGSMATARWGHQAAHLAQGTSGNVLIIGGSPDGTTFLSSTESFNPSTQAFTAGPSMATPRLEGAVAIRSDGKAFMTGGQNAAGPTYSNTAEVYDPVNNTWFTATGTMTHARGTHDAINLNDGRVLVAGGEGEAAEAFRYTGAPVNAGRMTGIWEVLTVPNATSFTYLTPDTQYATTCVAATGTVTPWKAITNSIQGPFIYDTQSGAAITATETTLTSELTSGDSYATINVTDASAFPDDEGYLAFGYGTSTSLFPVRYISRISSNELLIDPSYIFTENLPIGSTVTLLAQRGSWVPESPETVGTFYVTAAAAGRIAASNTVDDLVAAGVKVVKTVVYPSDVGLGNEGQPVENAQKISDKVSVWGGDDVDLEIQDARDGD